MHSQQQLPLSTPTRIKQQMIYDQFNTTIHCNSQTSLKPSPLQVLQCCPTAVLLQTINHQSVEMDKSNLLLARSL